MQSAALSLAAAVSCVLLFARGAAAQPVRPDAVLPQARAQIDALLAEKRARTPAERKIDSQLLYGLRMASGRAAAAGVTGLRVTLPRTPDSRVILDVRAPVTVSLLARLRALGAEITGTDARYEHVGVHAPLGIVEAIAAIPAVRWIAPELGWMTSRSSSSAPRARSPSQPRHTAVQRAGAAGPVLVPALERALGRPARVQQGVVTHTGSVTSEGDVTHRAAEARSRFGVSGLGVKIGVLSDGVDDLADSQATGNLGAVTVLPGQAGFGKEGTAMLEIIADLAPAAQLYFATATSSITSFAQNIRALRAAGCDIIVDDVSWLVESPFQDGQLSATTFNGGVLIQAVKDVAASGASYFSSAGNFGNLTAGTSGTWEGDFVDGGPATGPVAEAGGGQLHSFGGTTANTLLESPGDDVPITLHWSDPLGGAGNDYDLFLVDSAGLVVSAGTNGQAGAQDPFEFVVNSIDGDRLVIVRFSGAARYLHLSTNGGRLSIATAGATHGHAATSAANTFGVAAAPACSGAGSAGPCTSSFTAASRVETFSSDGPRRIFFDSSGAPITPGNVSSTGGRVLNKPDITAADGVSTSILGFTTFFGTSAAAPHAAAIAALIKNADISASAAAVSAALTATAIDIQAAGVDRDSGYGIVMAFQAVEMLLPLPTTPTGLAIARTGPSTATLSWAVSPRATSYNVRVSSTAEGAQTLLVNTTATSVPIGGLTRGQPYFFFVSAVNAMGESASAGPVSLLIPMLTPAGDVDGDGRADLLVWRASTGTWYWTTSASAFADGGSRQFGNQGLGDVPFTADIDGDRIADLIVWRASTGTWYWTTSSSGFTDGSSKQWGNQSLGDTPLLGDVDGDGKSDLLVWRASTGTFYWTTSASGYTDGGSRQWGNMASGDAPFVGDVDGDGRADLIVWRASTGTWYWTTSSTGFVDGGSKQWGNQGLGDVPLIGDMDGDGRIDLIVWRASTGTWYWTTSSTGFSGGDSRQWGNQSMGDVPRLRDIDGDGRLDLTVWRGSNGTWYWLASSTGYAPSGAGSRQFGNQALDDVPVAFSGG